MSEINHPRKRILVRHGFASFEEKKYKKALSFFSQALSFDPNNLEAKIGAILCDMAEDLPDEAHGFYELYESMLKNTTRSMKRKVQEGLLEAIESFDSGLERVSAMLCDEKELKTEELDGILYSDFKQICSRIGFKKGFENLIFSTKIIFTQKEDFFDFLNTLVDYGFNDYCLQYIESMRGVIHFESQINKILQRIIEAKGEI